MTVDEIKQAHLLYWKHTESCWQVGNPAQGTSGCAEHNRLYAEWQAALMACPGVYVNAASIHATGQGTEWWHDFLQYRATYRIMMLTPSEWHVMCDSEDDAQLLKMHMLDGGIPLSAIKLKTYGQCQHLREA